MATGAREDTNEQRIVDATLACIARWGLSKTTLDDVARQAGLSRATVYRAFPGGRDAILAAALHAEFARFLDDLGPALAVADTLADLLAGALGSAMAHITGSEALAGALANDPELLLPSLALERLEPVVAAARAVALPHLSRFLGSDDADLVFDLCVRTVLSYGLHPSPGLDAGDPRSVRRFVDTVLVPA